MRDRGVDGQLGHVLTHAVVVVHRRLGQQILLVLRRELERAAHGLARAAHALRVAGRDADDTEIVQHTLRPHGSVTDAVGHHRVVAVRVVVQPVRAEDHFVVLVERIATEWQRRVGGRADHVGHTGQLQDVRHVPAAAPFDVEGMDGATGQHAERVFHRQALVEAISVQRDLHVEHFGDVQRRVERSRVRAHVLVHLEAARTTLDQCFDQRCFI